MPNTQAAPVRAARLKAQSKPVNSPDTANRITRAALTAELVTAHAQIAALSRGVDAWKRKAKDCERLQGLLAASRSLADQTAAKLIEEKARCEDLRDAFNRALVEAGKNHWTLQKKVENAEAGAAELAGALRESIQRADRLEEVDEYQTALIRAQVHQADKLAYRVDLLTRYGQKADAKIVSLEKVRALQLIGATLAGAAAAVLAYEIPLSALLS